MRKLWSVLAASVSLALPGAANAATLVWADWTAATNTAAQGTIGGLTITFTGNIEPPAQTSGGVNYWAVNSGIYTPTGAENPPPDSDIIRLFGGPGTGVQTITFSAPVTNPLMAIMSMGNASETVTYVFNAPFDILNQGAGYFGGNPFSLTELPGNTLQGIEGHGLIQFIGTFTSISWTAPSREAWHGFQIALSDEAVVPVPAAAPLLLTGLLGLAGLRRRLRRSRSGR
jgi:hypothetical protein